MTTPFPDRWKKSSPETNAAKADPLPPSKVRGNSTPDYRKKVQQDNRREHQAVPNWQRTGPAREEPAHQFAPPAPAPRQESRSGTVPTWAATSSSQPTPFTAGTTSDARADSTSPAVPQLSLHGIPAGRPATIITTVILAILSLVASITPWFGASDSAKDLAVYGSMITGDDYSSAVSATFSPFYLLITTLMVIVGAVLQLATTHTLAGARTITSAGVIMLIFAIIFLAVPAMDSTGDTSIKYGIFIGFISGAGMVAYGLFSSHMIKRVRV